MELKSAWFFVSVVAVTLVVWLALGRGWEPLLTVFILGSCGSTLVEQAVAWRRRGME